VTRAWPSSCFLQLLLLSPYSRLLTCCLLSETRFSCIFPSPSSTFQLPHHPRPGLPPHRRIRPQRACHVLRLERARRRRRRSLLQLPHHPRPGLPPHRRMQRPEGRYLFSFPLTSRTHHLSGTSVSPPSLPLPRSFTTLHRVPKSRFRDPKLSPDPLIQRAGRDHPFPIFAVSPWRERDVARG